MDSSEESQKISTTDHKVLVRVDDREPFTGAIAELLRMPKVEVRVERLPIGDFLVENRAVIERKTVADFCRSLIDGRLFGQAHRLSQQPLPAVLILEGRASQVTELPVRREALQGAMVSLSTIFRLPVLRSLDAAETARLIVYAGRQLQRHSSDRFYLVGRKPKGKRRAQMHVLQSLPGIGPDRARLLLDRFTTLERVIVATHKELADVPGIGPVTAGKMREILSETPLPYRTKRREGKPTEAVAAIPSGPTQQSWD